MVSTGMHPNQTFSPNIFEALKALPILDTHTESCLIIQTSGKPSEASAEFD